ncbi:hypothetical protein TrVFT333_010235 [Trichoderma virens FT-333]|nr:hypothetical protein TrVFT333_010235 [Trichoderma virens FT-333]
MSASNRPEDEIDDDLLDAEDVGEEVANDDDLAMDSDNEELVLQNDSIAFFDLPQDSLFTIAQHPVHPSLIAVGGSAGEADNAPGAGWLFDASAAQSRPVLPASYASDPSAQPQTTQLESLYSLQGHTDSINALTWTLPQGEVLVSAGLDGRIKAWKTDVQPSTGVKVTLLGEAQEVEEINWVAPCPSPSNPNTIALGANDGSVWVYTIDPSDSSNPLQIVQSYFLHTASCTAGAWTPDGQLLATVSEDGSLYVWDVWGFAAAQGLANDNGMTVVSLTAEDQRFEVEGGLYSIAIDPKGAFLATGGAGGAIKIVSLPRLTAAAPASGINEPPTTLLAAGSVDGSITVFDATRRFAIRKNLIGAHEEHSVVKVEFVPNSWLLTSCGMDGVVRRWDLRASGTTGGPEGGSSGLLKEWRGHRGDGEGGGVLGFVQGQTGERVVTAGDDDSEYDTHLQHLLLSAQSTQHATMSEATLKPEKDFSKEVDQQLPEAESLAKTNLQGAIEKLAALEKQTRQASDLASTSRILVAIVTLCKNAGDWSLMNDQTLVLSKKHSQLKQAITKMVQTVVGFLDDTPDLKTKLSVIETLRTVTEGKIFVEVERARVTKILSDIKKQQGDVKAATEILCELQVETFGSMDRREKTEFILAQVALCIESGDWTQAAILGRKISTRYLSRKPKKTAEQLEKEQKEREKKKARGEEVPEEKEDDTTDLKLRYYEQQITLAKHEDKYLDACKNYRQVLDTEAVEEDAAKLRPVLQRIIYFVILAPYDNEQHDLLQRIHRDSRNSQVSEDAELLRLFTVHELMRWPEIAKRFGPHLCGTDVFDAQPGQSADEKANQRWEDLRKRVIEHNVRVIAKYYTRIQMSRLTELLDLAEDETEKYISELVTSKTVYAKIDRPARIVSFAKPRDADDVLNEWSHNMKSLLGLLERIDHLITKEEMMARIQPTGSK